MFILHYWVQELEGQYYLIYSFVEGRSLPQNEITAEHCSLMGDMLARLHKIDFSPLGLKDDYSFVDENANWDSYLAMGEKSGAAWTEVFRENLEEIKTIGKEVSEASKELSEGAVISHGGLVKVFVSAYMKQNKIENPNWRTALQKSYQNKLGWLNYSFKRSLGIDAADQGDREIGTKHVFGTIASISKHKENVSSVMKILV